MAGILNGPGYSPPFLRFIVRNARRAAADVEVAFDTGDSRRGVEHVPGRYPRAQDDQSWRTSLIKVEYDPGRDAAPSSVACIAVSKRATALPAALALVIGGAVGIGWPVPGHPTEWTDIRIWVSFAVGVISATSAVIVEADNSGSLSRVAAPGQQQAKGHVRRDLGLFSLATSHAGLHLILRLVSIGRHTGSLFARMDLVTDSVPPQQGHTDAESPKTSTAWKVASVARWMAALVVAVLALLATRGDVCHLTTTNLGGLAATSQLPKTETVSACSGVGFSDAGYFLVIAVLLLPDARSISIGGFRFERLTSKLEEVRKEVGALSQNLTQTFNFGADALNELRAGLRSQKAELDEVRESLPDDARIANQLTLVDDVARRSDDASPQDILHASITAATLIEEAKHAATAAVDRSTSLSVIQRRQARSLLQTCCRILDQPPEATDDQPDADA